MDTLFAIKTFCKVVEQSSFTKAAEQLNISNSKASKLVSYLESTLETRLLNRTSRQLTLTHEGELYYQQALTALEHLNIAEREINQAKETPKGKLRIALPIWCANTIFSQWIVEYQTLYPNVIVELILDNAMNDLVADNLDIALRASSEITPSLIARPLLKIPFLLVATQQYLEQSPPLEVPQDLEQHEFVLPSYVDISQFEFINKQQQKTILQLQAKTYSNNTLMLKELVLARKGIAYLPAFLVQEPIQQGKLQQLFAESFHDELTLHAVYLSRHHLSPKIRSFIDFMASKA